MKSVKLWLVLTIVDVDLLAQKFNSNLFKMSI